MTITQRVIHEHAQKRTGKLKQVEIDYFQARVAIRVFPELATSEIAVFKRCYPEAITYLRYLEEIADDQSTQPLQQAA